MREDDGSLLLLELGERLLEPQDVVGTLDQALDAENPQAGQPTPFVRFQVERAQDRLAGKLFQHAVEQRLVFRKLGDVKKLKMMASMSKS